MIWLIGCKGMLGTEVSNQFDKNDFEWIGLSKWECSYMNDINIIDFVRSSLIPELEGNRLESCYNNYIKNKNADKK
jgi:hypothetical protein